MRTLTKAESQKTKSLKGLFLPNYPSKSRFAEAYRTLRTNVDLSFLEKKLSCILVTSAGEAEGKTLTVANYAANLAEAGKTVLMLDADLRKPSLSRLESTKDSPGLTGLLTSLLGTPVEEGQIGEMSVNDIIRLLELQKKTGNLTVSGGDLDEAIDIFFLSGEIVDCSWKTPKEERTLSDTLVKNGLISQEQAKLIFERSQNSGQKLGFVLANSGMITWEQLSGPLKNHVAACLRTALQISKGKYFFKQASSFEMDRSSFYNIDFKRVYIQLIGAGEHLPFITKGIKNAISKATAPGLYLLPSGLLTPNPSELLGSLQMRFLLTRFRELFDVVVIDSPPILPTSDALTIAPFVDGVIFIIKEGNVNKNLIKKAVDQLEMAKANIVGVVLNQVDVKGQGYYKYYQRYYSGYYGK